MQSTPPLLQASGPESLGAAVLRDCFSTQRLVSFTPPPEQSWPAHHPLRPDIRTLPNSVFSAVPPFTTRTSPLREATWTLRGTPTPQPHSKNNTFPLQQRSINIQQRPTPVNLKAASSSTPPLTRYRSFEPTDVIAAATTHLGHRPVHVHHLEAPSSSYGSKPSKSLNKTPKMVPMAVLLSLEGVKVPNYRNDKSHANQDRAFIHEVSPSFTFFAVFDGHGEKGHEVSQFVSNAFQQLMKIDFPPTSDGTTPKLAIQQLFSWLKRAFARVDNTLTTESRIDCTYSGSTASIAVRYQNTILVAYVGDSKTSAFQFHGKRPLCLVETPEHNPSAAQELERIRKTGATVVETTFQYFSKPVSRITQAGLSVSRAFGDLAARPHGVISEPDFVQIDVPPRKLGTRTRKWSSHFPLMLIVASDGLWDTISPHEILSFVSNAQQPKQRLFDSTRQIAEVAWRRRLAAEGRADDTTVIVALLQ